MNNPILENLQKNINNISINSPSKVSNWLKGKLIKAEEGNLCFEYIIREEMTNPFGTLHGGMSALILDDIIGASVYSLNNKYHSVSVNLNTEFLIAARVGETITAEAKIIRNGNSIVNAEAAIYDKRKRIIAKASSNLIKITKK